MTEAEHKAAENGHDGSIHLPSPTGWPIMLAFGFTMLLAGLVTTAFISIFGAVFMVAGCVGWFRQVLPHEEHEAVPLSDEPIVIVSSRTSVERVSMKPEHRHPVPSETYPVIAGIKGGIAGGIFMVIPAVIYGLIAHHSIWYPINLLGGAGVGHWVNPTTAQLAAFHWQAFLIACVIHGLTCLLVGLLYAATLPILPRYPMLLGGLIAPLLWSAIIHSFLGFINPALDARISWPWFVVSQVAFGVVAGWIVSRQTPIHTDKKLPLAVRMGVVMPGISHPHGDGEQPQDEKEKH